MFKNKFYFSIMFFLAISFFNTVNVKASSYTEINRSIQIEDVEDLEVLEKNINTIPNMVILENRSNSESLYYKILIPRNKSDENINKITELGTVVYDTTNQKYIENDIIFLETVVKNKESHKNVIIAMLKETEDINTVLKLEQYLVDAELAQTNSQRELNQYLNSVENITLNLEVIKTEEDDNYNTKTFNFSFTQKLKYAFKNSLNLTILFIQNILIILSYLFVPIIIISFILIGVFFAIKKGGKK